MLPLALLTVWCGQSFFLTCESKDEQGSLSIVQNSRISWDNSVNEQKRSNDCHTMVGIMSFRKLLALNLQEMGFIQRIQSRPQLVHAIHGQKVQRQDHKCSKRFHARASGCHLMVCVTQVQQCWGSTVMWWYGCSDTNSKMFGGRGIYMLHEPIIAFVTVWCYKLHMFCCFAYLMTDIPDFVVQTIVLILLECWVVLPTW